MFSLESIKKKNTLFIVENESVKCARLLGTFFVVQRPVGFFVLFLLFKLIILLFVIVKHYILEGVPASNMAPAKSSPHHWQNSQSWM